MQPGRDAAIVFRARLRGLTRLRKYYILLHYPMYIKTQETRILRPNTPNYPILPLPVSTNCSALAGEYSKREESHSQK